MPVPSPMEDSTPSPTHHTTYCAPSSSSASCSDASPAHKEDAR